jgi:hypothetical protein
MMLLHNCMKLMQQPQFVIINCSLQLVCKNCRLHCDFYCDMLCCVVLCCVVSWCSVYATRHVPQRLSTDNTNTKHTCFCCVYVCGLVHSVCVGLFVCDSICVLPFFPPLKNEATFDIQPTQTCRVTLCVRVCFGHYQDYTCFV